MHSPVKRFSSEYGTTEFNNEPLTNEFSSNNNEEEDIVEEVINNVEFSPSELSWVELVEQVHQDKGVENDGVVLVHELTSFSLTVELGVYIVVSNTEPVRNTV